MQWRVQWRVKPETPKKWILQTDARMKCRRKEETRSGLTATNCLQDKTWGGSIVRSTMIAVSRRGVGGWGVGVREVWGGGWVFIHSPSGQKLFGAYWSRVW